MKANATTIRKKLIVMVLITAAIVLGITFVTFSIYEYLTFKKSMQRQLSSLGEIIAENSTAALAFDDKATAGQVLSSLKAEKNIIAAYITDSKGGLFARYVNERHADPGIPDSISTQPGFTFHNSHLVGAQPVQLGSRQIGTLYLVSSTRALTDRLQLYAIVALLVVVLSFTAVFLLSKILQRQVSRPILSLAETARAVAHRKDYTVRVTKYADDELGFLTDTFNQMLWEIEQQNNELLNNQEKISSLNEDLEHRVRERTQELQAANKELESFSYSVSHDLRAPLRSIQGYMKIFDEEYASKLDDEARRIMNIVLNNAGKLGQLIDDLLEFSRLGRTQLSCSEFSMRDLVVETFEASRSTQDSKQVKFTIEDLPHAYADWRSMKHVWQNLITNALKYSKYKTESVIHVGASEVDGEIAYYIRDNGAGFDMNYYDKLFGVFQRLHSSNEFEGTGVGLAIVNRILQKHGGKIWAEAAVNEGATFYFYLPPKDQEES